MCRMFNSEERVFHHISCSQLQMGTSTAALEAVTEGRAIVLQLDGEGKIVSKMTGSSGEVKLISEVAEVGENLYFGSCCLDFLGVISKAEVQKRLKEGQPSAKTSVGKEEL